MDLLPYIIKCKICAYLKPTSKVLVLDSAQKMPYSDINQALFLSKNWSESALVSKWESCDLLSLSFTQIKHINANYKHYIKRLRISNYNTQSCEKRIISLLLEFTRYGWPNLTNVEIIAANSSKIASTSLHFALKAFPNIKSFTVIDGLEIPGLYSLFLSNNSLLQFHTLVFKNTFDSSTQPQHIQDFFTLIKTQKQLSKLYASKLVIDPAFFQTLSLLSANKLENIELFNCKLADYKNSTDQATFNEYQHYDYNNALHKASNGYFLSSIKQNNRSSATDNISKIKTLKICLANDGSADNSINLYPKLFPSINYLSICYESHLSTNAPSLLLDNFTKHNWRTIKRIDLANICDTLATSVSKVCPSLESLNFKEVCTLADHKHSYSYKNHIVKNNSSTGVTLTEPDKNISQNQHKPLSKISD
ncbi:hypothetical protein BB561_002536 [Smittium simulii]|uniref:F-box domain-containing protein n=1 Tax=Smittium simulii TaxID=133385 RepID=A0A2T9YQA6_9FUNG|nr:hypothetical protein BB561_002536 [Smittium simulii]